MKTLLSRARKRTEEFTTRLLKRLSACVDSKWKPQPRFSHMPHRRLSSSQIQFIFDSTLIPYARFKRDIPLMISGQIFSPLESRVSNLCSPSDLCFLRSVSFHPPYHQHILPRSVIQFHTHFLCKPILLRFATHVAWASYSSNTPSDGIVWIHF